MHLTTTLAPWSSHDTQLILPCVLGLALIIVFISVLKLAPFLSILVGTFAAGFSSGLPLFFEVGLVMMVLIIFVTAREVPRWHWQELTPGCPFRPAGASYTARQPRCGPAPRSTENAELPCLN